MAERETASGVPPPGARADAGTVLREVRFAHAWDVRGDARQPAFVERAQASLGMPLPLQPQSSLAHADRALLRLGPKTWLFLGASSPGEYENRRDALNAVGGALFDLSSSYAAWHVSGRAAERVLNRLCPLDLHRAAFPAGTCTQSLLGHVAAIFHRLAAAPGFLVLVPRSLAEHAWHELRLCAEPEGCVVAEPWGLGEALNANRDGE